MVYEAAVTSLISNLQARPKPSDTDIAQVKAQVESRYAEAERNGTSVDVRAQYMAEALRRLGW